MVEAGATILAVLLDLRRDYIGQAIEALRILDPADYFRLTVSPREQDRTGVQDLLTGVFLRGAGLIVDELNQQGGQLQGPNVTSPDRDDEDSLQGLADLS